MKRFAAYLLLLGAMLAQSTIAADQKSTVNSDDRISDQVRMKLATDPDVKGGALDVVVKDGVVTIKGRVDTDKGKTKATKLAKKVKGVKDVDNELVGRPAQVGERHALHARNQRCLALNCSIRSAIFSLVANSSAGFRENALTSTTRLCTA